jgi:hypothetical protein
MKKKKERSGVHKFLRKGRITGVAGSDELVAFVEQLIARIVKDLGVATSELSADQQKIVADVRRYLIAVGLVELFRRRGHVIVSNDERLVGNLHVLIRGNLFKLQRFIAWTRFVSLTCPKASADSGELKEHSFRDSPK